jgi:thymidylate synthase (FAD)
MNVKLVSLTPDAEKQIAYCARVSSPNQDNPEYAKLLAYCIQHKHYSIFEQAFMSVEIETTRMISAQILRHRSFTFQEFSQRYAEAQHFEIYEARRQDSKNRQNSIDDLSPEIKAEWQARQLANCERVVADYNWALENGVAKECARAVLPMQTVTRLYMTGSIRSWIHYLEVRCSPDTQLEHRVIALEIKKIFVQSLPVVAEALGWTE